MKRKIIYVDFIKRRRINFMHFIIKKIISLLRVRFKFKNKRLIDVEINNNRRVSN